MVGREVLLRVEKPPAEPGDVLLEVEDLHVVDDRGIEKVRGVSFERACGRDRRHRGRRRQRADRADRRDHGARKIESGTVKVAGRELAPRDARARCSTRASATFPRTASGEGSSSSSRSPRTSRSTTTPKPPDAKWGWLFPKRLVERARTLIREFDVRGGGPLTRAGGLSGGNQQKVVAAREIARDPKVLIAAQPTRGLDVGAIEYLHRRLVEERGEGRAILLISLELEEILSLSDRILVLYEGEIVGEHARRGLGGGDRPRDARRRHEGSRMTVDPPGGRAPRRAGRRRAPARSRRGSRCGSARAGDRARADCARSRS